MDISVFVKNKLLFSCIRYMRILSQQAAALSFVFR